MYLYVVISLLLSVFYSGFKLPGEAQKIDRLLECFSSQYFVYVSVLFGELIFFLCAMWNICACMPNKYLMSFRQNPNGDFLFSDAVSFFERLVNCITFLSCFLMGFVALILLVYLIGICIMFSNHNAPNRYVQRSD